MNHEEARHPGHHFNEATMRTAYDHLYQLRQHAITTEDATEYTALNTEASQLEQHWLTGPTAWALQWRYLDNAVENWANDPDSASGLLHQYLFSREPAHTETAIERDSQLQAERLTQHPDAATPAHTSALTYIATYNRTGAATAELATHTSWWKAREWVGDHAIEDTDTPVDLTISAHDLVSGKRRVLTTATAVPATDVLTELDRLTAVLGGAREPDGKEFVDDLHYEILCDDYQAAMTAANHPDAEVRRFEHKLCADDVRDQTLDFARSIGRQDAVETLASIDHTARTDTASNATPHVSWLDQITDHAERTREQISWHGIDAHYTPTEDPTRIIHAGRSPGESLDPWYGEELRLTRPGEHTGEIHRIGRYATCEELLTALESHSATAHPDHSRHLAPAVPSEVVTRLREFDQKLRELDTNLTTSTTIRAAIRSGQPVQLKPSGQRAHTTGSTASSARDPAPTPTAPGRGDGFRDGPTASQTEAGTATDSSLPPPHRARDAAGSRRVRITRQPNRSRPHRRQL